MKVFVVHDFVVLCFGLISSTDKTVTDAASTDIVIIAICTFLCWCGPVSDLHGYLADEEKIRVSMSTCPLLYLSIHSCYYDYRGA